jgi:hypothetical protein
MSEQTTAEQKQHGGKREGAGRPKIDAASPTVTAVFRLTAEQRAKLKALGGSAWLRRQIDEASERATRARKKAGG